jgi:hypothetical protein
MDILLSKKPYNVQEYRNVAGSNIVFLFKGLSLVVPYIHPLLSRGRTGEMNLQTYHKKWKPKPLEKFHVYAATTAVVFLLPGVCISIPKMLQPNPRTFEAATM